MLCLGNPEFERGSGGGGVCVTAKCSSGLAFSSSVHTHTHTSKSERFLPESSLAKFYAPINFTQPQTSRAVYGSVQERWNTQQAWNNKQRQTSNQVRKLFTRREFFVFPEKTRSLASSGFKMHGIFKTDSSVCFLQTHSQSFEMCFIIISAFFAAAASANFKCFMAQKWQQQHCSNLNAIFMLLRFMLDLLELLHL